MASAISSRVLPTPAKMIRSAGTPAARRPLQLAGRDHVHAGAEPGHGREHGLVGVGLDGEADEVVGAGERLVEHAVLPLERRGGIAIERRADGLGEAREAHALGVESAAAIVEVVHGAPGIGPGPNVERRGLNSGFAGSVQPQQSWRAPGRTRAGPGRRVIRCSPLRHV